MGTKQGKAHWKTRSKVELGVLLADVIQHLTTLTYFECGVMALEIIENYGKRRR